MSEVLISLVKSISCNWDPWFSQVVRFRSLTILTLPCKVLVSSSEWVESSQLDPSSAHFIISLFSEETAHISTSLRNTKHVHVHYSSNWVVHVSPTSPVVSKPVRSVFTWASKGTSGKNERSIVSIGILRVTCHVLLSCLGHHKSIEGVKVILGLVKRGVCSIQWHCHDIEVSSVVIAWDER